MNKIIQTVIFATFLGLVKSACQDLDAGACAVIKSKLPDMCSDPCIAVICSDTCNNCPLKCYHCDNQLNPEDCKTTMQCKDNTEVCIAIQRLTTDYIPLYSSGCESRDVCMKVFGNINIRRSLPDNPLHPRSLTLKGGCCDVDKCNTHDPENNPTEPPGYVRTTLPNDINPTYSTDQIQCVGTNMDESVCSALQAIDPNICSKNCVSQKLCQGMCKTCVKCFKCDSAPSLDACQTTDVCKVNQKCVNIEQLGPDFVPRYRLGCMDESICVKYFGHVAQGQPVGKRQLRLQGGCCEHSLCNNKTLTTS